jgi:hypothetical protein
VLTGKQFFPQLLSGPFHHGLVIVFSTAMTILVIAAGASLLRGGRYVHEEQTVPATADSSQTATAAPAGTVTQRPASNGDGQPAAADGQPASKARPPA